MNGISAKNLRNFRQFYLAYQCLSVVIFQDIAKLFENLQIRQKASGKSTKKAIGQTPSDQLAGDSFVQKISQKISAELSSLKTQGLQIQQLPTAKSKPSPIWQKPSAKLHNNINNQSVSDFSPQPVQLIKHFSFSHFVELMRISEPLKRTFYEIEGIKGCWSVPQLKRQIESLLYERIGLSTNKKGVVEKAHTQSVPANIDDVFRDPYILEFTGLPERYEYSESDLETDPGRTENVLREMSAQYGGKN